jgi:hypothetical protein
LEALHERVELVQSPSADDAEPLSLFPPFGDSDGK